MCFFVFKWPLRLLKHELHHQPNSSTNPGCHSLLLLLVRLDFFEQCHGGWCVGSRKSVSRLLGVQAMPRLRGARLCRVWQRRHDHSETSSRADVWAVGRELQHEGSMQMSGHELLTLHAAQLRADCHMHHGHPLSTARIKLRPLQQWEEKLRGLECEAEETLTWLTLVTLMV